MQSVYETQLKSLKLIHRGKVRDMYEVDAQHLLVVATDRISAFDVVFPTPIPGKGAVLTEMSNFWFNTFHDIPNHLSNIAVSEVLAKDELDLVGQRAVVVKRLQPLAIEAIVRGYIVGSGWKEYQQNATVCGIQLPNGLKLADALPETIFTPSTKADVGEHDENIDFERACEIIGKEHAVKVKELSINLYERAAKLAKSKGIIIADTKFEFGLDQNGVVTIMDEVLTPDSSRFWPVDQYQPGANPPSFDKQYVRDYLETLDWNKKPPAPELPQDIVDKTAEKYQEALQILTQ